MRRGSDIHGGKARAPKQGEREIERRRDDSAIESVRFLNSLNRELIMIFKIIISIRATLENTCPNL